MTQTANFALAPGQTLEAKISFYALSVIINNQSNCYLTYNGQYVAFPSQQLIYVFPSGETSPQLTLSTIVPPYTGQAGPAQPQGTCYLTLVDQELSPFVGSVLAPLLGITIPQFDTILPSPVVLGGLAAAGTAATVSHRDHVHAVSNYQEGIWVPTDASGAGLALTINNARYTKIGRAVFISCYIVYPANANGLASAVGGLPFQNSAPNGKQVLDCYTSEATLKTGLAQNNGVAIIPTTATGGTITNATLSGDLVIFSGFYFV